MVLYKKIFKLFPLSKQNFDPNNITSINGTGDVKHGTISTAHGIIKKYRDLKEQFIAVTPPWPLPDVIDSSCEEAMVSICDEMSSNTRMQEFLSAMKQDLEKGLASTISAFNTMHKTCNNKTTLIKMYVHT